MGDEDIYNMLHRLQLGRTTADHVYAMLQQERERRKIFFNQFLFLITTMIAGAITLMYLIAYLIPSQI